MPDSSSIKVGIAWQYFHDELSGYFPEYELKAIANIIFEHLFHLTPALRILNQQHGLPEGSISLLQQVINDLKKNVPVQYITGIANFCGLEFKVDKRVLIPRPETEELVEWVLAEIKEKKLQSSSLHILDVCTGSGCIAISLAHRLNGPRVEACDISREALMLARENAQANRVIVNFIHCDVLNEIIPLQHVDIIVCNPPYVTPEEKSLMQPNVVDYEPHMALFTPADDPMLFYRAVARQAFKILKPQGMIFFEINENYPAETSQIVNFYGFENTCTKEDFHGKLRFIYAQKPR